MQPPGHDSSADDYLVVNRLNWDERVAVHVASGFYGVERFLEGEDHLHGFESEELGDLTGRRVVHLQCHFGMDTLSLARRGALVTGLDFSPPAIAEARALAARLQLDARFVEANVYDAVEALGETYDLVYTGKGALNWIPDLATWAQVAADLLEPGGALYLSEYHPLMLMLADDGLEFEWPYFNSGAQVWDEPGTYADPEAVFEHTRTIEWPHPLSEIIGSIIDAGLRIELFHEFAESSFARFPFMEQIGPRLYQMPAGMPQLPLMYSIRAIKPT
ncbi:MAG: class I SAM-dependent methyltransferase [Acidimicrobiales bacterium]|jgi:SAM-dependent methyltransferase